MEYFWLIAAALGAGNAVAALSGHTVAVCRAASGSALTVVLPAAIAGMLME